MDDLVEAARQVRRNAYCPYSGYAVGAALRDEKGRIHVGTNVENVAYGSTLCAERAAILRMVSEGGRKVAAIALVTADGGTPCGACLQVLAEFADETQVVIATDDDIKNTLLLEDLLPHAFASPKVMRT